MTLPSSSKVPRRLGVMRSSSFSTSSCGRKHDARVRRRVRPSLAQIDVRFRSQAMNDMMFLLLQPGLRYNENAIAVGAQTERRGLAGPVRDLLGGETSPAALFYNPVGALLARTRLTSGECRCRRCRLPPKHC